MRSKWDDDNSLIFPIEMPLTQKELDEFHTEGIVHLVNYLSPDTIEGLLEEVKSLHSSIRLANHPKIKFETDGAISDKYFIDSSDKIHYFLDPSADASAPTERAVNKIGHGIHFLNDKFNAITVNDDIASTCRQLGFNNARAVQSMLVIKQPHFGAAVNPHSDAEFLYTDPVSCVGFWFPLEDCTEDNGCIEYIPGSHLTIPVKKRFIKVNGKTKFVHVDDLSKEYTPDEQDEQLKSDSSLYKKLIIPKGSMVLIDGRLIHRSKMNTTDKSRIAYTFHVVDGKAKYDDLNWLQIPPNDPQGSILFTNLYKTFC